MADSHVTQQLVSVTQRVFTRAWDNVCVSQLENRPVVAEETHWMQRDKRFGLAMEQLLAHRLAAVKQNVNFNKSYNFI